MGSIEQYTVTQTTTSIRLNGGSRCVIRVDGDDLRIAYQRQYLDGTQYFTIKDGEAFVFDPSPITGDTEPELGTVFYVQSATATGCTVQVWLQGQTQGA